MFSDIRRFVDLQSKIDCINNYFIRFADDWRRKGNMCSDDTFLLLVETRSYFGFDRENNNVDFRV